MGGRHYDELRVIENRLDRDNRTEELIELLSAHYFSIGYGAGARAAAMIERVDRYLNDERFSERQKGRLHLLGALAGIAARQPERIAFGAGNAVVMLRSTDSVHELAMALQAEALQFVVAHPMAALERLDEAAALAEATGAPTLASYSLSYRAFTLLLAARDESGQTELAMVAERLEGTPYDAAHSIWHQATIVERFIHAPAEASATFSYMREAQERLGVPFTEAWQSFGTAVTANLGDVTTTAAAAVASLRDEYRRNGNDGLPDLLIPLAVLAWRLGDLPKARRWLTAIRYAERRVMNLPYVGIYRQLRAVIGLEPANPTASASLAQIGTEALLWMEDTAQRAASSAESPHS